MKQYLDLMQHILDNGVERPDRTGTGTISVFGYQLRFDLQKGFPLLTTKKLHTRSIFHELLWFLKGSTNTAYLHDNKVTIWDEWADENGDLGPIYGKQWRAWEGVDGKIIDQIKGAIHEIKNNPYSRRTLVSAWNVTDLDKMALPPCHILFQFYVADNRLSCHLYQRSADTFLGLPFDIASYALLTHMIAQVCDLGVGELIISLGDTHLYLNHIEQAQLQLTRTPYQLPTLKLSPSVKNISDFKYEDISIENYQSHPHIKAEVSI